MADSDALMTDLRFFESRADTWDEAADSIIGQLKAADVRRGQIVSIDAHSNGPDTAAIFSAHFSENLPDLGPLEIEYQAQNRDRFPWHDRYREAHRQAEGRDLISITSSCNSIDSCVVYVFYYATQDDSSANERFSCPTLEFVESRGRDWSRTAGELMDKLHREGVQPGQILWIDAHNNRLGGDAIFSAHFSRGLPAVPGRAPAFAPQAAPNWSWDQCYKHAILNSYELGLSRRDLVSITGSSDGWLYTWYYASTAQEECSGLGAVMQEVGLLPTCARAARAWCHGMGMASVADFDLCSDSEWQDFARAAKLKPVQARKMTRNIQSTIDAQLVAEWLQISWLACQAYKKRSPLAAEGSCGRP